MKKVYFSLSEEQIPFFHFLQCFLFSNTYSSGGELQQCLREQQQTLTYKKNTFLAIKYILLFWRAEN